MTCVNFLTQFFLNRHSTEEGPDSKKAWGMYGTLPRSMRETKLVTNVKEMVDEDQLKQRQDLVTFAIKNKSLS